ncbi:MAG: glycosyltransferase family 39 protein [Oscillochloridaceae bacterium]|nr:glycosyltransferase family 39 protein [Chloroflexaceae bacterium]MDW8390082.1 glycosyltransferase family 39 protein [Oscillochloridaceae bacterium]
MNPRTFSRRLAHRAPLLLILMLALAWRLVLWAQPLHEPANDEVEYLRVARDLLAGQGWSFYEEWRWLRAPLYPLFLAGSLWLAGGDLQRAALPNIAASVAVVYLVYRLARELASAGGERAALLAALAAALLQTGATFASLYMSETLFSLLFGGALLSLAVWRRAGGAWRLALAGALFGLACLTRSAALVFLPALMLWVAIIATRREGKLWPRGVLAALLPAVCAALVIAPWTIRNCRAYTACVLIETGFAYNLWAFYEPREDLNTINRTLEAIPDPVARADEAARRGLERLREDPAILLRKLPVEWSRLWAVKIIQDRFLLPSYYADPPPPVFLAGLLLDDLLYLLVLLLAGYGLALGLSRRDGLTVLLALWMALFIAVTLVTHAEGRYRHFLFIAMLPLAGVAANALPRRTRPRPLAGLAVATPLALALLPLSLYYPWSWALEGTSRSLYRWAGDALAAAGRFDAAERAYRAALAAHETPDGWLVLGDLRRRQGDLNRAAEAYDRAFALAGPYPAASARRGDLLRELGRDDEARRAFEGRYLDPARLTDWSYRFLRPRPAMLIDLGNGLDFGYVGQVYPAELAHQATGRWTGGDGRLRLGGEGSAPGLLTLRVTAPWPDGQGARLCICAGETCTTAPVDQRWRVVRVLLPTTGDEIALRSPTFVASDGRRLGVFLDWAELREYGVSGEIWDAAGARLSPGFAAPGVPYKPRTASGSPAPSGSPGPGKTGFPISSNRR